MTDAPIRLPLPTTWSAGQKRGFLAWVKQVAATGLDDFPTGADNASLAAAYSVVADLSNQGWIIKAEADAVLVEPPRSSLDPAIERARIQAQEWVKRDEQLRRESVRHFIRMMETPRLRGSEFVSIFDLMRDGTELSRSILGAPASASDQRPDLAGVVEPYVQIVEAGQRCTHTGLLLTDIWRYFRHTWTNQHTSTPGRTMMILVRDSAVAYHPVIGIAALGSPVVQLGERDEWIGWQREQFLSKLTTDPSLRAARWLWSRLDAQRDEIYVVDLLRDGLYWPSLWERPTTDAIEKLESEAARCRAEHHRFARASNFKSASRTTEPEVFVDRAETALFRSKRCLAIAGLLRSRAALLPHFIDGPSRRALTSALGDRGARDAIASIARKAKADAVGTEMADLTVCGAIAPYNELLGGKLVAMLAVSPTVVRAYHERYGSYAGEIASAMAGRPIVRRNRLVFVGTTSLYGSQSSQYNRLSMPAEVLGGAGSIEFRRIGKSRSFGTSHLSDRTVAALVLLAEQTENGARVNSIFGEGVNPKLRKVRHGLDLLGWPSDQLLQHGRQRLIYGIPLVSNLLPYLMGLDSEPAYRYRINAANDTSKIVDWWVARWADRRLRSPDALERLRAHNSSERPVTHGARVRMPSP